MWKSITLDCDLSFQANQTKQLLHFWNPSDLSRKSLMGQQLNDNRNAHKPGSCFSIEFCSGKTEAMFGNLQVLPVFTGIPTSKVFFYQMCCYDTTCRSVVEKCDPFWSCSTDATFQKDSCIYTI